MQHYACVCTHRQDSISKLPKAEVWRFNAPQKRRNAGTPNHRNARMPKPRHNGYSAYFAATKASHFLQIFSLGTEGPVGPNQYGAAPTLWSKKWSTGKVEHRQGGAPAKRSTGKAERRQSGAPSKKRKSGAPAKSAASAK